MCVAAGAALASATNASAVLSFGEVQALNGNASTDSPLDDDSLLSVAADGNGTWVAVWSSTDSLSGTIGTDADVLVTISLDNGGSWSAPAPLNSDAGVDFGDDELARVATDGAGTWVAVWQRLATDELAYSRSVDNGATWTAGVAVDLCAFPAAVVSLGGADWLTLAATDEDIGGAIGTDTDLVVLRSTDSGVTWGPPVVVNSDASTDATQDSDLRLATDGAGNVVVVWSRLDRDEILSASSIDGGITWGTLVEIFGSPTHLVEAHERDRS